VEPGWGDDRLGEFGTAVARKVSHIVKKPGLNEPNELWQTAVPHI
jgi:hypothetical protein